MSFPNKLGIHNFGNSCYLNSTLQCLFHADYFINFMSSINQNKINIKELEKIVPNGINNYTFLKYISQNKMINVFFHFSKILYTINHYNYHSDNTYTIVPINFYKSIQKNFKFHGQQQDVSELITFFIDRVLHESLQKIDIFPEEYKQYNLVKNELQKYSPIIPIFYGIFKYITKCKECKNITNKYEPFNIINLHLTTSKNNYDLDTLLDELTQKEKLYGDNAFFCDKCNKKTIAFRKLSIIALPDILIIKIVRYNAINKNNNLVNFPFQLQLKKYFLKTNNYHTQTNYNLFGIINHYGNMNGGHYIACCKDDNTSTWFLYDDTNVIKINDNNNVINKNAYILFYKKMKSYE